MMNKKLKRIISVLLVVCASVSLCVSSYASPDKNTPNESGPQYTTYSLQDMRAIAMNALLSDFMMEADNGTWDGIEIVKETPLYDIGGNLTSYCFDLKCNQQNSYIVISATSKDYPVMQFAPHASSQYLGIDDSKNGIYAGPGQYFIEGNADNSIIDLVSGQEVEIGDENIVVTHYDETVEDFDDVAQLYISGTLLDQPMPAAANVPYKLLSGVPQYQWYLGCVPTAMAMILGYHYSGFEEESLIEGLATNMNTNLETGFTYYNKVPGGTTKTLSAHKKSYTSVGYASTGLFGIIQWNESNNTLDAYQDEILANRPVFIAMNGAKGISTYYPTGFGDHAITGVGFNCASQTTYLIVHTTATKDGDVSVPFNSTSLGKYAWCFVVP